MEPSGAFNVPVEHRIANRDNAENKSKYPDLMLLLVFFFAKAFNIGDQSVNILFLGSIIFSAYVTLLVDQQECSTVNETIGFSFVLGSRSIVTFDRRVVNAIAVSGHEMPF